MHYRHLGRTGLKISVIGVGTWQFGGEWGKDFSQAEVDAILAAARDCGINFLDTAECYGDHLSERFIGAALAGQRDRWIIATKFGHHFHEPFRRTDLFGPADVVKQLDDSLRALRTDYIDLLQCHSAKDEQFGIDLCADCANEFLSAFRDIDRRMRASEYAAQTRPMKSECQV